MRRNPWVLPAAPADRPGAISEQCRGSGELHHPWVWTNSGPDRPRAQAPLPAETPGRDRSTV